MKEYLCIKDYYIEDSKFAKVGDYVILLPDNRTVVNTNGEQKVIHYPQIVGDKEYFTATFEIAPVRTNIKVEDKIEDKVNHPSHYTWLKDVCGIEVIDITRHMNFNIGNALKYLLRSGHKTEQGYTTDNKAIEDLEKAIFYIKDEINRIKK